MTARLFFGSACDNEARYSNRPGNSLHLRYKIQSGRPYWIRCEQSAVGKKKPAAHSGVFWTMVGFGARVDRNYRCVLIFLLHSLTFLLSVLSAVFTKFALIFILNAKHDSRDCSTEAKLRTRATYWDFCEREKTVKYLISRKKIYSYFHTFAAGWIIRALGMLLIGPGS